MSKKIEHPPYGEMIASGISTLKVRGGASRQALKAYLEANYLKEVNQVAFRTALKKGVEEGFFAQAGQSFKLTDSGRTKFKNRVKSANEEAAEKKPKKKAESNSKSSKKTGAKAKTSNKKAPAKKTETKAKSSKAKPKSKAAAASRTSSSKPAVAKKRTTKNSSKKPSNPPASPAKKGGNKKGKKAVPASPRAEPPVTRSRSPAVSRTRGRKAKH